MIYSQTLIIISTLILLLLLPFLPFQVQAKCKKGCDLALASYYLGQGSNLTYIGNLFGQSIQSILNYNPHVSNNESNLLRNTRINVPFTCNCLNGEFLGHTFNYPTQYGDTYSIAAQIVFSNLTTVDWLERVNSYEATQIPDYAPINVTINCSCGNRHVSRDYGLFVTYPLRLGDNLTSIAAESGVPEWLLEMYNSGVDFGGGSGLVFVPAKDEYGNFPPMKFSTGKLSKLISGISTVAAVVFLLIVFFCIIMYRRKKAKESSSMTRPSNEPCSPHAQGSSFKKPLESMSLVSKSSPRLKGITLDKSVEFTYEELARATDGFCLANKIGRGGFGSVYYAEIRGEKAAIKKMDMDASKEFLAELKVLTRVHHLNLVRLIGYCVEGALFLVYEFIENGNLSQHLRGSGREPLPWLARVQIALDAARGLEYIHEHTVPVYIHRDIKSANILIDKKLRGKVADFGLSKLAEYGSSSVHTCLVGTFGYMSPEYAQYGDVSPKVDVYAFGVVLYELISAKEAILKSKEPNMEAKGLVALFEEVLSKPSPEDALCELIDPRLGDNYPLESLHKMALLAKACTQDNPQLRPSMRSIVVALMTLSSSLEEWDVGSFYENHNLDNLVIGR